MRDDEHVRQSKYMVQVARHGEKKCHARIRSDGGININEFLRQRHVQHLGLNFKKLINIVRTEKEHGKMRLEIFIIRVKVKCFSERRKGTPSRIFKMNKL